MAENNIIDDLQSPNGEALVDLFELELNEGTTLYFHPGTDENYADLVFDGNTYTALPIELEGVEVLSDGANARPSLTIANVTNVFKAILNDNNFRMGDIIGKKITRRRTLEKYLGNPDEIFEFPSASYIIDRIAGENNIAVEFELASPFDVEGVKLPSRIIVGKYCSWIYQGKSVKNCGGCSWLADSSFYLETSTQKHEAFFDTDDRPFIFGEPNPIPPPSPVPEYWEYNIPSEGTWTNWASPAPVLQKDSLTKYQGRYWRSDYASNTEEPSNNFYTELLLYTDWSNTVSYSAGEYVKFHSLTEKVKVGSMIVGQKYRISLVGNTDFTALGASSNDLYTEFTATGTGTSGETGIVDDLSTGVTAIWKSTIDSTGQEPYFGSPYWLRADSCSKTLGGCKSRFQIRLIEETSIPSVEKNTRKKLPFGAFPGSVKFK